jgi:hypothetical protein
MAIIKQLKDRNTIGVKMRFGRFLWPCALLLNPTFLVPLSSIQKKIKGLKSQCRLEPTHTHVYKRSSSNIRT